MSEQVKFIVQELSQAPFNKKYNILSFTSLENTQLLQLVTDVFGEIDPLHKVDLRTENLEQTGNRLCEAAVVMFRYKMNDDPNEFRSNLMQGDKTTIYELIEWVLRQAPQLQKRTYLAKYLVKVQVPPEFLQSEDVSTLYSEYNSLIDQFKEVHRSFESMKTNTQSPSELKKDIQAMEVDKEQLLKRVEKQKQKVMAIPNSKNLLELARRLRIEREKQQKLYKQIQELRLANTHMDSANQRAQKQLEDYQQAATNASPEGLLQRAEDEMKINTYMVNEKLPKEHAHMQKQLEYLLKVEREPTFTAQDLNQLRNQIRQVSNEVSALFDKRMQTMESNSKDADGQLTVYRQQAAVVTRKKESLAEQLRTQRDELSKLEADVNEHREKARVFSEGAGKAEGSTGLMRFDEMKSYVQNLKVKHAEYKRKRAEYSALQSESGVLNRTLTLLQKRKQQAERDVQSIEASHGVVGYHKTQAELEKISEQKSNADMSKEKTLAEMSDLVQRLEAKLQSKKTELAPLLNLLRPLRQEAQELEATHREKKANYEATLAGLETQTSQLDKELRSYKEELCAAESRFHYLQAMKRVNDAQMQRVADESRSYVGSGDKKKTASQREAFQKRIQELETAGKTLRDRQKNIKEAAETAKRQVKLWRDVEILFQAKIDVSQANGASFGEAPPTSPMHASELGRSNSRSSSGTRRPAAGNGVNRLVVD